MLSTSTGWAESFKSFLFVDPSSMDPSQQHSNPDTVTKQQGQQAFTRHQTNSAQGPYQNQPQLPSFKEVLSPFPDVE
jgi:hypothetical protein